MGKVVILGGNARSGKSTLAYKLVKHGFSRISFDQLVDVLEETFSIDLNNKDKDKSFKFFENYLNLLIKETETEDINYVVDMYDYMPKEVAKLTNLAKVEVYFLAYPDCTKEEIKYNVIHYAKPTDWIAQVNEDYLNSCVNRFYEKNRLLKEECAKYHMPLIDTKSGESRVQILQDLCEKIINNEK